MALTAPIRAWAERYGVGAASHLAREARLTWVSASRLIQGKARPRLETAQKIAPVIGCSVGRLLGLDTAVTETTNGDTASPTDREHAA
jgi:plasmid maintenance system antidote protein VapI